MNPIQLNFLPILERDFAFPVYRKPLAGDVVFEEGVYSYSLPEDAGGAEKKGYLVSFLPKEGFELYMAFFMDSRNMTKKFLVTRLVEQLEQHSTFSFEYLAGKFLGDRVEFTVETYKQGRRIIYLTPYFLEKVACFGFLIDFRFSLNSGQPYECKYP